ncbi:MAG: ABC transporter ATP-binding protein [Burkholderiales bacterium]|nr:ABC transporter ATP-binding protein [Pseudomonadota bacterium]
MAGNLTLQGIAKSYGGAGARLVLRDVNLSVAGGEYIAIAGESGSGKSTLLNLIAGLNTADAGVIELDGIPFSTLDDDAMTRLRRERMGFVFQAFHLMPHLTVAQNIGLPLALLGVPRAESAERVVAIADSVGLAPRLRSFPRELSGGEMQRVAIARALIHAPRLVLADEPTGNLDSANAHQVLGLLGQHVRAAHAIGIVVTHSQSAAAMTDKVYRLNELGALTLDARGGASSEG